jgi:outer membrane protein assembly factor BamB
VNIDLLPDGGQVIVCRNNVYGFDKTGKQTMHYARNTFDILAGHHLPNGDTVLITNNGQPKAAGIRINAKGALTDKKYSFGQVYNLQTMDVVGEENLLICESNGVAEYDLKTGKQVWKYHCNNPSSCQRLFNGNTLICLVNHQPRGWVIEVDPSGEVVWEYEGKDVLRPGRAYRR